jgi:uncharacterized RDD family membrane protein YckC
MEREVAVTPPAAGADEISALVHQLLRGYQEVFVLVSRRPTAFWWLPHDGRFVKSLRTPRLRSLVPTFTAHHAARSARALKKQLHSAAVDAHDPNLYEREVSLLERFEASLPTVPARTLLLALAIAVLGLSYWTARSLGGSQSDVQPLRDVIGGAFVLSRTDIVGAVRSYHWHLEPIYFTALGLTASLWVLLLLPITSFRLKRGLFNVCPGSSGGIKALTGVDLRGAHGGIYELERTLFEKLGRRPPREVRFDLGLEASLVALALFLGGYLAFTISFPSAPDLLRGDLQEHGQGGLRFLLTAALILASLARLRLIRSIGRSRTRPATQVHPAPMPTTVRDDVATAGWGRRCAATLLDCCFFYLLWFAFAMVAAGVAAAADDAAGLTVIYVSFVVLGPLYVAASYGRWGPGYATLGKRLLKLRVVGPDGATPSLKQVLVREVVLKWIVFGPIFFGFVYPIVNYLRPLWNDRRATFYDDWLHDRVVHVAPEPAVEAVPVAVV